MKNTRVLIVITCILGLVACKSPLALSKSQQGRIDSGKYIDITSRDIDARTITKKDMIAVVNTGLYVNGESQITINNQNGTIELYSKNAFYNGTKGHVLNAKFTFVLLPAGKNCLYIRQANRSAVKIELDGVVLKGIEASDFITCVPLYGFGENRLEVSAIMNGYNSLPSGTYWKQ